MQNKTLQMKRALRTALLVLLLSAVGMGKGYAYDFSAVCETGQTLYYNIIDVNNHFAALTHPGVGTSGNGYNYWSGYTRPTGNIILPGSVQYGGTVYTITSIDDFAFELCYGLTGSLLIPNSVISIGRAAFAHCENFNGLAMGDFVNTIGTNAFFGCSGLMSINIPNSVNSIGTAVFDGTGWYNNHPDGILYLSDCCLGYKGSISGELSIQDGTRLICDNAFWSCNNLTGNLIIPNSVTTIGSEAFRGCNGFTGSLTIPNSVTTIGNYAFSYCNGFSGNLTIGNSVTTIGDYAFRNCSGFTGTLYIGNSVVSIDNTVFSGCSGFSELYYNAINCDDAGSNSPFHGWQGSLTIGSNVERIPNNMFKEAAFSGSLNIPNSVTSIGNSAFKNCTGFSDILTIGNSVITISDYAFENCTGFTGILTIGNSVTLIGQFAFYDCSGFTGVNYTGDIVQWCNITFLDEYSNPLHYAHVLYINDNLMTDLVIPEAVTEIKQLAFVGCTSFTGSLIIPNSVTAIGIGAFAGCSGFTGGLSIPNSITAIGRSAFANCSGFIGSLTIPNSVTTIGEYAFYNCSGFSGLAIGSLVNSIGYTAFYCCNGISTVDFYATNCSSISSFSTSPIVTVNIGENVQAIPSGAFANCTTLNTIISFGIMPPALGADAFVGISPVAALFVPCGSQMAYFSNWNIFEYNNIHEDCTPRPVSISSNIYGGTVTSSVSQATMGQEVILNVTPNSGMQLTSITAYNTNNPSQIVPVFPFGNSYRFIMPPYAVTVSATFDTCVLLEENGNVTVDVYPNPTNGQVKVEAESLKHITIGNMLGQVIYDGNARGNEFAYDFSKHKTGFYLIRIETSSGVAVKKVSVTR